MLIRLFIPIVAFLLVGCERRVGKASSLSSPPMMSVHVVESPKPAILAYSLNVPEKKMVGFSFGESIEELYFDPRAHPELAELNSDKCLVFFASEKNDPGRFRSALVGEKETERLVELIEEKDVEALYKVIRDLLKRSE